MHTLAQVANARREIDILHREADTAAVLPRGVGFAHFLKGHFPETIGTVPELAPQSTAELTDRECTILQLLSQGFSNKEAARSLGISPETVKTHVKNIFQKLRVDRRAQAVSRALGLGFIATN